MSLPGYLMPSVERMNNVPQTWISGRVPSDDDERFLLGAHERAVTLAEGRAGGSYEYDDEDLIEVDGTYWIVNTSGCSCPDPADTWGITAARLPSLDAAATFLLGRCGSYETASSALLKDMVAKGLVAIEVPQAKATDW